MNFSILISISLLILTGVIICSLGFVLFPIFAKRLKLIDVSNSRSAHQGSRMRGGGIIFTSVWLIFTLILGIYLNYSQPIVATITVASAAIAGVGFWDDLKSVSPVWRSLIHFVSAIAVIMVLQNNEDSAYFDVSIFVVLAVASVWSINLFNFMDGTDGIAAVEGIVLNFGGSILFFINGDIFLASCCLLLCLCLVIFLKWNWPQAKFFMGDVGSGFLGFIISIWFLLGFYVYDIPLLVWAIMYGLFLVDATFTLIRRILRREKWYQAHKNHAYQRLHHVAGWSHLRILIGSIIVNIILLAASLTAYFFQPYLYLAAAMALAFLIAIYAQIEKIAPFMVNDSHKTT